MSAPQPARGGRSAGILAPVRALGIAIVFASLTAVLPARAQLAEPPSSPSDADVALARERFVRGIGLAQQAHWQEALDEFFGSYALSGSPVALFNAASALRELGRFREARDAFDRLLADPELDEETRVAAERLRTDVAAQVGRVTVEAVPPGEATLTLDGRAGSPEATRPLEVEVDPGSHALAVAIAQYRAWRWSGTVQPGARLQLSASLEPLAGSSFDPLPWILGGAAAVVIGVVVALLVVDANAQLGPRTPMVIRLP